MDLAIMYACFSPFFDTHKDLVKSNSVQGGGFCVSFPKMKSFKLLYMFCTKSSYN